MLRFFFSLLSVLLVVVVVVVNFACVDLIIRARTWFVHHKRPRATELQWVHRQCFKVLDLSVRFLIKSDTRCEPSESSRPRSHRPCHRRCCRFYHPPAARCATITDYAPCRTSLKNNRTVRRSRSVQRRARKRLPRNSFSKPGNQTVLLSTLPMTSLQRLWPQQRRPLERAWRGQIYLRASTGDLKPCTMRCSRWEG